MGCLCAKNTNEEQASNLQKTPSNQKPSTFTAGESNVLLLASDGESTMYASKFEEVSPSDPSLRLIIKVTTMSANSVDVQIRSGATIAELKRSAQQNAEFLSDEFWLVWDGKVLEDDRQLSSYGFNSDLLFTAICKKPKVLIGNPFIKAESTEKQPVVPLLSETPDETKVFDVTIPGSTPNKVPIMDKIDE